MKTNTQARQRCRTKDCNGMLTLSFGGKRWTGTCPECNLHYSVRPLNSLKEEPQNDINSSPSV